MVLLAIAGVLGPLIFTALVIGQGWRHPDYSHVAMPISALATWPSGWIQNLNFYLFGGLSLVHALGLHVGIRARRLAFLGPGFLLVSAIGIIVAGLVPMTRDSTGALREPAGHAVGAVMAFLGAGVALILLSRRMADDPLWRNFAGYTLGCGIVIVGLFLLMAGFAVPDDGALHDWFGLLQRAVLAVWFPCTVILSLRLLSITRTVNRRRRAASPSANP